MYVDTKSSATADAIVAELVRVSGSDWLRETEKVEVLGFKARHLRRPLHRVVHHLSATVANVVATDSLSRAD